MLCLLEDMVGSGPEMSLVFPYGPSSVETRDSYQELPFVGATSECLIMTLHPTPQPHHHHTHTV